MRRFILGMAMTALVALVPSLAAADDQQTAQQIAEMLRSSGRLVDYSIGVKYEEGTAWLMGRVANQQQLEQAVAMTSQLPYVQHVEPQLEVRATRQQAAQEGGLKGLVRRLTGNDEQVQQVSYPELVGPVQNAGTPNLSRTSRSSQQQGGAVSRDAMLFGSNGGYEMSSQQPIPGDPLRTGRLVSHTQEPQAMTGPQQAQPMPVAAQTAGFGHHRHHGHAAAGCQNCYGGSGYGGGGYGDGGMAAAGSVYGGGGAVYDQASMPCHAWPSYAAYPNYAGVTYPTQYSASAWPYIGPFYPYPQVPLGWRKVTLEWDDGWWMLEFDDKRSRHPLHNKMHHANW